MKSLSKCGSASLAAWAASTVLVVASASQAPQGGANAASGPTPSNTFPAPTNLKVLPRDLTGKQVHDMMERWEKSLGARCDSCHTEDIESVGRDGRPGLKFADDSKPMKTIARLMYTMTDEINTNYVAKVEGSGMPVTCGTCHRGHLSPEPFMTEPPDEMPAEEVPVSAPR